MLKRQFMESLRKNLNGLPDREKNDILEDIEEFFEVGAERGRQEEEIVKSFGNPRALAKQIKAESYIKKAEETTSATNIARAVYRSIGLSFFNLLIFLPVFLSVAGILIALFSVAVSISATGISGTVAGFFYPLYSQYLTFSVNASVMIFAFMGIGALGILFFIGDIYIARYIYRLTVMYLRFNINLIKGRRWQDEV
ncbi:MAG: DUF1700 domain-containing protein [Actinobacteria bacterium]|nr:DUF1700 domain-containing protein [Actinomycetota bacterium]